VLAGVGRAVPDQRVLHAPAVPGAAHGDASRSPVGSVQTPLPTNSRASYRHAAGRGWPFGSVQTEQVDLRDLLSSQRCGAQLFFGPFERDRVQRVARAREANVGLESSHVLDCRVTVRRVEEVATGFGLGCYIEEYGWVQDCQDLKPSFLCGKMPDNGTSNQGGCQDARNIQND